MALTATVEPEVRNVRLDYTVPAGGATLTISRTGPSGTPAAVRSWQDATVLPGAIIARDFEAPIGVPLTYTAQTKNSSGTVIDTSTTTITLTSGGCSDTWLNDLARVNNTMRVELESLPQLEYEVTATAHEIIRRRAPIIASDIAHTPGFELSFLTETLDERDQARELLGHGAPALLRTPPDQGIGNLYFAIMGYREERIVTLGAVADRRFVVTGRQVDRPDPALYAPAGATTYASVKTRFATYADLKAQRANYDAVLYDWTGSEPGDVVPWPPVDV